MSLSSLLGAAAVLALLLAIAQTTQAEDLDASSPSWNCTTGWTCKNKRCIPLEDRCNGVNNCGDNSDEKNCPGVSSSPLGYVAAAVASLFFGTNFIPVKKFDTGDGMFFQWVLCAAVWFVGFIVQLIVGGNDMQFYPYAALGGASWATGNLMTVPIIQMVGLAQGLLVWGTANMVMGWASGRFGLFGIVPNTPKHVVYQDIGIVLSVLSGVIFALIKPSSKEEAATPEEASYLLKYGLNDDPLTMPARKEKTGIDAWPTAQKRIVGIAMAVCAGIFYGMCFDPSQYYMDNHLGATQNALHYAFSQFSGIFFTSTFWFMAYCAYKRNAPSVNPSIILPACVSGMMWAIAQSGWFVANQHLSQAVAFPIICTVPGLVASLFGVFVFKEIQGRSNYIVLVTAFLVTGAGVAFNVLSN